MRVEWKPVREISVSALILYSIQIGEEEISNIISFFCFVFL